MSNYLMLPDRFSFYDAFLSVSDCLIQSTLGHTHGPGRRRRTTAVEDFHGNNETVSFFAQQMGGGYPDVIKNDFGRIGSVLAHLVERLAHAYAFPIPVDDEAAHPSVPLFFVCVSEHGVEIGHGSAGDEGFRAVQDVMVPFLNGRRLNTGHV